MHLKTIALVAVFLIVATLANGAENNLVIHMPGAQPTRKDDYLCSVFSLKNLERTKLYFTGFDVNANLTNVGYVGIFRCNNPSVEEGAVYSCRNTETFLEYACHSSYFMFDWGRYAGPMSLPEDVGFELDGDNYLIMQVHYKVPLDFNDNKTSALIQYTDERPKVFLRSLRRRVNAFQPL